MRAWNLYFRGAGSYSSAPAWSAVSECDNERPDPVVPEAPDANAPAHLLPQMATTLGVSVDVLLGTKPPKRVKQMAANRLERRLLEIEKLDVKAKRQITQLLDTFIEHEKLKRKSLKTQHAT